MMEENKIILYKDKEGKVNVNVRFADEDVWLTQAQLADIYNTTQQNISLHQKGIYADGELDEEGTRKKFFLVRQEGKRQVKREIDHYNLDMIIALGYRGRRQELLYPHETRISSSDDFSRLISCLIQF